MDKLLSPFTLGPLLLPNRVVMAPMTRSRAASGMPNDLMREYYMQRASAGLIVSEGIAPSPDGQGYARIPGLYTPAQVEGWRAVTSGVHEAGGRIVAQLMHTGRIGHERNLPPGARVVAPSSVQAAGTMWTDDAGMQPMPTPEAMTLAEVEAARDDIVSAARNAIAAGFDAVELHGANGYLLEQFIHPHSNRREDAYGGTYDARNRFVVEVVEAVAGAIGRSRVGVRLSPHNTFNDLPPRPAVEVDAQYTSLAAALRGVLYLHIVGNAHEGFPSTAAALREAFDGPVIANGGFDAARAEVELASGRADLVSFGRPFIANPDLVRRIRNGVPLATPEPSTFYTPGPQGYLDYAPA